MSDDDEILVRDINEFFAELERVCPEAADGLAIGGPPPPQLTVRERIELLKTLPDNAGVDRFLAAWYAARPNLDRATPDASDRDA
jgi:hypothetical protein